MINHSGEPWESDGIYIVGRVPKGRPSGEVIGQMRPTMSGLLDHEGCVANARRAAECVSACEGIADPYAVPELLKACKAIAGLRLAYCDEDGVSNRDFASLLQAVSEQAAAAIAKSIG